MPKSLLAEVIVKVDEEGTLEVARVRTPSGVAEFDAACLAAIRAASPVKPPPEGLRRMFGRGLMIQFDGR